MKQLMLWCLRGFAIAASFPLSAVLGFAFWATVLPEEPATRPAQDGIELIPQAAFWLTLVTAIAATILVAYLTRGITRKNSG